LKSVAAKDGVASSKAKTVSLFMYEKDSTPSRGARLTVFWRPVAPLVQVSAGDLGLVGVVDDDRARLRTSVEG
jgi:hypothetical protein